MTRRAKHGSVTSVPIATKTFRVEDDLWQAARARARQLGRPMADVVDEILADYAEGGARVVPPTKHTPRRSVKVPVATWTRAQQCAAAAGETVTDAIRRGLRDFASD